MVMYRIYVYGGDVNNDISEIYTDLEKVDALCKRYREEGLMPRVYLQSQNKNGDLVERLLEDI